MNKKKHTNTSHNKVSIAKSGRTVQQVSIPNTLQVPIKPKTYVPKCTWDSLPGIIRLTHILSDKTDRIHTDTVTE